MTDEPESRLTLPRLYPIIDTALLAAKGIAVADMARALAKAGAGIVQFRHKAPYTREALAQAEEVGHIVCAAKIPYVINDRADVALMAGADGVHVGQDDLPVDAVRKVVGLSVFVGYSTHNEQQLREGDRQRVDYLAIGPIFGTTSKENPDPTLGLDELSRLRSLTSKPLVAIGGITRANARQVLDAGADSVAVISDLLADDLSTRLAEWTKVVSTA